MTLEEIIDGCRAGNNAARRELYELYAGLLYGVICRYVRDRDTAQDLLHDTFITIYTKIGEYSGRGAFAGWCRRIAVNTALSHLRRHDPLTEGTPIEPVRWLTAREETALERMSAQELMASIDRLPQGFRTVLNLYAVEGYSHREIAELLGVSENTSRSQYSRARNKLAEILAAGETK